MQKKSSKSSGISILLTGLVLLAITFILAFAHLQADIKVLPVPSLASSFALALSSLIEAVIRVLYLGILGLIASTVTTIAVNVLLNAKTLNKNSFHSKRQISDIRVINSFDSKLTDTKSENSKSFLS